jgi:hypothetical protein
MDGALELNRLFAEMMKIGLIILIRKETSLTVIAALDQMDGHTR